MLILADLHLGKSTHFRKHGLPVHSDVLKKDLIRIRNLFKSFEVETLLILGDLFHSSINAEWEIFCKFIKECPVKFVLMKGNHDKFSDKVYEDAGIYVHKEPFVIEPFIFSHHPMEDPHREYYGICGHIHPAISLRGVAKQSLSLPCFYFGEAQGILPSFGSFTGSEIIFPASKKDKVFVIAEDKVIAI